MNYYLDTEFHEYHKQQKVCGIKIGKAIPTINLISIGIVDNGIDTSINIMDWKSKVDRLNKGEKNQREYYAISKDFDIKAAWNSYQIEQVSGDMCNRYPDGIKVYWLRENILRAIWGELIILHNNRADSKYLPPFRPTSLTGFTYKNFKTLINMYGKTNKQIAEEIIEFTTKGIGMYNLLNNSIKFYGYHSAYDWVILCQLFGKMIDLPKGFPMYCIELKQELDNLRIKDSKGKLVGLQFIKDRPDYPKQDNEHNALSDAKWNKKLHEFINEIK